MIKEKRKFNYIMLAILAVMVAMWVLIRLY